MAILLAAGLLGWAVGCKAADGSTGCHTQIRAASIDFGETPGDSSNLSVTEFTEALSRKVMDVSGLDYSIESLPYARAIRDFSTARVTLIVVSASAIRPSRDGAVSLPLYHTQMSSYRSADAEGAASPLDAVGILNGIPLPRHYREQHRHAYPADSYDSLFKMLVAHHLGEIVVARPRADIYLNNHPELKARISQPVLIEQQTVAVHLNAALDAACIERLRVAVDQTRGDSMIAIAARYLPGVQTAQFLIPPLPAPQASPPPAGTPAPSPQMMIDMPQWLGRQDPGHTLLAMGNS